MNYLETLNKDLLLVLLSKMKFFDLSLMERSYYDIKKLLMRDENYEYLLMHYNPDLHNFIKNIENIDGSDSWCNIYCLFKTNKTVEINNSYHSDLFFSYKIKCDYPDFYLHIEGINLNREGFGTGRVHKMWIMLKRYSGYDFFEKCPSISKYKILRNLSLIL